MEYSLTLLRRGFAQRAIMVLILILMEYSLTTPPKPEDKVLSGLNPYSNGILSDRNKNTALSTVILMS